MPVSKIRRSPIKKAQASPKSKVAVIVLEKVNTSRRSEGSSKSPRGLGKSSPRRSNSAGRIASPKGRKNSVKKLILESSVINSSRLSRKDLKNASTPKVTLRRSLNLTASLEESSSLLRKKSSTPRNKSRNRSGIENESEPEMSDTSLINMSDVFESDISQIDEKNQDGTYELDEPKTPGLKAKKATKRPSPANSKRLIFSVL